MRNTRKEKGVHSLTIIATNVSSSFIHVSLLKPSVIAVFMFPVLGFWVFGVFGVGVIEIMASKRCDTSVAGAV